MKIIKKNACAPVPGKELSYEFSSIEIVPGRHIYDTFLDWLSAEFPLYLKEKKEGLRIHFPKGWLQVMEMEVEKKRVKFKITVKSNCEREGIKLSYRIKAILNDALELKVCR